MQLSWAGKGVLALATGEPHIRLWDLDRGDNYAVRLDGHYFSDKDAVMSLAYCSGKGQSHGGWRRELALQMVPARGRTGGGWGS